MAKKILPYRDYSEHDVVNLYALDAKASYAGAGATLVGTDATLTDWSQDADEGAVNDAGVVVTVNAGSLPGDSPANSTSSSDALRAYLGSSHGGQATSHIGYSSYPHNEMTVAPASGQSPALGITLRETLAYDENGEKMLYYPQKLDEAQAVLPGQTVPILTRGLVLLKDSAFSTTPAIGNGLTVGGVSNPGKLVPSTAGSSDVGLVIATGQDSDAGAGAPSSHVLCKLSF